MINLSQLYYEFQFVVVNNFSHFDIYETKIKVVDLKLKIGIGMIEENLEKNSIIKHYFSGLEEILKLEPVKNYVRL
jgi:hypothetical protein